MGRLTQEIIKYSRLSPTGVSLKQMVNFGSSTNILTLFNASQFIIEELPIRLSQKIVELNNLSNNLNNSPSILKVKDWYTQSFEELIHLQNNNILKNKDNKYLINENNNNYFQKITNDLNISPEIYQFNELVTKTLIKIKSRHDPTVPTVAKGVIEWKDQHNHREIDSSIQEFLDRFYMSRIGIRMLIGQHIALNQQQNNVINEDYVGIICLKTNIKEVVEDSIDNSRFICEQYYGIIEAPKVNLKIISSYSNNENLEFMYVPSHLHHILFEILKNSLRATIEFQLLKNDNNKHLLDLSFPDIDIVIVEGNEDITIKISDRGGGIPKRAMPLIWTYLYTTAKKIPNIDVTFNNHDNEFIAPMAGLGYGISLSRLYARYFGGDLELISMEGYGTDAYIHLNKLGSSSEPLP